MFDKSKRLPEKLLRAELDLLDQENRYYEWKFSRSPSEIDSWERSIRAKRKHIDELRKKMEELDLTPLEFLKGID